MPPGGDSRRQYLTLEAVEPDGSLSEVHISYDRMQTVGRRGMGQAKECAYIVPEVLKEATSIFEGLRCDEDEDRTGYGWRCYCKIPEHAFHVDGSKRLPYPRQVYVVFINDERVAYNWRWEKCDPDCPDLPIDYQTRFKSKLL